MPGKPITLEGLRKDFSYMVGGIDCHAVLFGILPPRLDLRILEPGCGSGKLGMAYALRGAKATLLDIDPGVLAYTNALRRYAMQHLWKEQATIDLAAFWRRVTLMQGSIHALPFPDNTFDLVFNEGVPQHWPDEERRQGSINEMVRVSKQWVCIIGSNAFSIQMTRYADTIDHTYMGMPPKQVPWRPDELSMRLEKAGLKNVIVQPVRERWEDSVLLAGWGRKD